MVLVLVDLQVDTPNDARSSSDPESGSNIAFRRVPSRRGDDFKVHRVPGDASLREIVVKRKTHPYPPK